MPFTVSHAAVALPFTRKARWNAAAVAVGAMAPDFGYYANFPTEMNRYLHSPMGSLAGALPLAVALFALCVWLRDEMRFTLPPGLRDLLERTGFLAFSWNEPGLIVGLLSLAVGVASHIVWDAFTHRWGFGVQAIPALQTPVPMLPEASLPLFKVLQHLSSLGGLALVLLFFLYHLLKDRSLRESLGRPEERWILSFWVAIVTGPVVIALASQVGPVLLGFRPMPHLEVWFFGVLTTGISSLFFIYLIILLFLKSRPKAREIGGGSGEV